MAQINNPKTEVPTGIELNDKDYMNQTLSCLKEMSKNYVVALTEASCENLYDKYKDMFNKYSTLQREVYELMFKNGWYSLETAGSTKINSKITMLNNELNNLN